MHNQNVEILPSGVTIHNYKIKASGVKRKIIYHFSDTHLAEYNEFTSEKTKAYSIKRTTEWEKARVFVAKQNEEFNEQQLQPAREHFINILVEAKKGDAFVMSGDIFEFVSGANLEFAKNALKNVKTPFLSVAGNHEDPKSIPDNHILKGMKNDFQTLSLDDIIIVGIDNRTRQITKEQNDKLKEILSKNIPIIIVMHTPIITKENQAAKQIDDYYILNHAEATSETLEFISLIKENADKIIAVITGHLHFTNNLKLTENLTQYGVAQGLLGHINRYEIGE